MDVFGRERLGYREYGYCGECGARFSAVGGERCPECGHGSKGRDVWADFPDGRLGLGYVVGRVEFRQGGVSAGVHARVHEGVHAQVAASAPQKTVSGWPRRGRVYFIGVGEEGPIKIGFTERTVADRRRQLQTSHPDTLVLLAIIEGDERLERDLHKRFAGFRLKGEWFRRCPELLDFIAEKTAGAEKVA